MTIVAQGHAIAKWFGKGANRTQVLHDVDFHIRAGECLAIIGESGSGKSTLTRILLGLERADSGTVQFMGMPVEGRKSAGYRALRQSSGLVLQHPFASLDPTWTVERSVAEPLMIRKIVAGGSLRGVERIKDTATASVHKALQSVGLDPRIFTTRYPDQLSGGQAQRVAIARAIVDEPQLIVADEPMSAIDVAARIQIIDAFAAMRQSQPDAALVVVSHDLGVVQHLADRIMVMQNGRVVEEGASDQVLMSPQCEYTKTLIAAASM